MRTLSDNDAATFERAVDTLRRTLPRGASLRAVNAVRMLGVIARKLQRQREGKQKNNKSKTETK